MKHESKDTTLTVDDLRRLILTRSFVKGPEGLIKEKGSDESGVIYRNLTRYILVGVIGIVVAMLAISILS